MQTASFWPPFRIRVGLSGDGGGIPPDPDPDESPLRAPLSSTDRWIGSGHSLMDPFVTWDYAIRDLLGSLGISGDAVTQGTIPGSSLSWRWSSTDTPIADGRDSRVNIDLYQSLIITEGGPPPRVGFSPSQDEALQSSCDYLARFVANAIENGDGHDGIRDIMLWSIWPDITLWEAAPGFAEEWKGFADFREALPEYGRTFKFLADTVTHRMHQLYPHLPDDWRIWLFPGHLWIQYLCDDIDDDAAPGITVLSQVFSDTIHVTQTAAYGICCLIVRLLYDRDLTQETGVHIPDGMSQVTAEYFWTLANRIADDYAPAGRGGTQGDALEFDPETDVDLLDGWTFNGANVVMGAPAVATAPTITGTAQVGETLAGTAATWTAWPWATSTALQWQYSPDAGATWANIAGATTATLVLNGAREGQRVRLASSATNMVGTTTAHSAATVAVAAGEEPAPEGLPAFLLGATPDGYTGPTLSSPPDWVDGVWAVPQMGSTGTGLTTLEGWRTQIGMVAIIRMSVLPPSSGRRPLIGLTHPSQPGHHGDRIALMYNSFFTPAVYQSDAGAESANAGAVVDDWQIVSVYHDGAAIGGWTGTGSPGSTITAAPLHAPDIRISGLPGNNEASEFGIELRGLWIWTSNGTLTDELAAVRALAATYLPE